MRPVDSVGPTSLGISISAFIVAGLVVFFLGALLVWKVSPEVKNMDLSHLGRKFLRFHFDLPASV